MLYTACPRHATSTQIALRRRMFVLPVLDLLNGVVVRGTRGRRDEYRPLVSPLVGSSDPLAVARVFREAFGLMRLYVADLNAILRVQPNETIYRSLAREGFELWLDAGLQYVETAERVLAAGASHVIAGLETWRSPAELARLCGQVGADRVVFSLDLVEGRPMGDLTDWQTASPLE